MKNKTLIFGQAMFFYGLIAWAYGILTIWYNPEWASAPFCHLTPWLRHDIATMMFFMISIFGFLFIAIKIAEKDDKRYKTYTISRILG